jgi:hypothetical protein
MILITRDLVRTFLDVNLGNAPSEEFASVTARYPELR